MASNCDGVNKMTNIIVFFHHRHHLQSLREKEENGGEGKYGDYNREEDQLHQKEAILCQLANLGVDRCHIKNLLAQNFYV